MCPKNTSSALAFFLDSLCDGFRINGYTVGFKHQRPAALDQPRLDSAGFGRCELPSTNLAVLETPLHLVTWLQAGSFGHVGRQGGLSFVPNSCRAHSAIFLPNPAVFKLHSRMTDQPHLRPSAVSSMTSNGLGPRGCFGSYSKARFTTPARTKSDEK